MFDTEAIFEWALGNLYVVGGAVGAALLITLVVLLLIVRRRKLETPPIEGALGPPEHDENAQGYLDPDEVGQMGSLGGFELDYAPGSSPGPEHAPAISSSGLQEPLPPEAATASSRPEASPVAAAAASPFADAPARAAASTGGDHVRKVVAGLLEGRGDFSGHEMRRLELLRPEKVLQAIDELESTISGRNKATTLARLAKIRQHAELLATGTPIAHSDAPTQPLETADAAPPEEQAWPEPVAEPTAEQAWPEPVAEPTAESPGEEPAWQEQPEEQREPPAETPVEPAWQEPITESPAESVWDEQLPGEGQEHSVSWQHSLTPPPPESVTPVSHSAMPDMGSTLPTQPVFQRTGPRNDSHWLPTAPLVPSTPTDEALDDELRLTAEQSLDVQAAFAEPLPEAPAEPGEEEGAPDEPVQEPAEVMVDEPAGEIEEYEEPASIPDTWDIGEDLASITHIGSSTESPGIDLDGTLEPEPELVEGPSDSIDQESHTLELREVKLEPLELTLETAEDVLALDPAEQTDALAFLDPAELVRVFTATTEKQLKLSVIDLLSQLGTVEAMNALEACLDDPDAEVQLYALVTAERLLGEA